MKDRSALQRNLLIFLLMVLIGICGMRIAVAEIELPQAVAGSDGLVLLRFPNKWRNQESFDYTQGEGTWLGSVPIGSHPYTSLENLPKELSDVMDAEDVGAVDAFLEAYASDGFAEYSVVIAAAAQSEPWIDQLSFRFLGDAQYIVVRPKNRVGNSLELNELSLMWTVYRLEAGDQMKGKVSGFDLSNESIWGGPQMVLDPGDVVVPVQSFSGKAEFEAEIGDYMVAVYKTDWVHLAVLADPNPPKDISLYGRAYIGDSVLGIELQEGYSSKGSAVFCFVITDAEFEALRAGGGITLNYREDA